MTPLDLSIRFFLQLVVILGACQATGWVFRRIGQSQVVSEMIAGVLLGPSLFGWLFPSAAAYVFPAASMPILFAVAQVGLVSTPALAVLGLVILLAATAGKGLACWGAARLVGESRRDALATGVLMDARGLMELIILNIGLERGIIRPTLFTLMVLMAVVTTLAATPLFERVYGRAGRAAAGAPAGA